MTWCSWMRQYKSRLHPINDEQYPLSSTLSREPAFPFSCNTTLTFPISVAILKKTCPLSHTESIHHGRNKSQSPRRRTLQRPRLRPRTMRPQRHRHPSSRVLLLPRPRKIHSPIIHRHPNISHSLINGEEPRVLAGQLVQARRRPHNRHQDDRYPSRGLFISSCLLLVDSADHTGRTGPDRVH